MSTDAENIIALYQRQGPAWAKDRGDRLFEDAWLDRFRALMPPTDAHVLDLGCGSGKPIARYLIEHGCRITGLDSAPGMIALCQTSFPSHDWRVADMRQVDLNRKFNGILAWDSFFHLCHEHQRRMFPLFRTHAAPGAALMFTSGPSHGEAIGRLGGEPLYHASLAAQEYRTLLAENGFAVVSHVAEDPSCESHTIWLARFL
jgi:trans-aconitate methyltransferase